MLNTTKVIVQFPTHVAHITVDSRGYIHVFKYNARSCDFDTFKNDCDYEAADYIQSSLPSIYYSVTFPGDD